MSVDRAPAASQGFRGCTSRTGRLRTFLLRNHISVFTWTISIHKLWQVMLCTWIPAHSLRFLQIGSKLLSIAHQITGAAKWLCNAWVLSCVEPNHWVLNHLSLKLICLVQTVSSSLTHLCLRKKKNSTHDSTVSDIWHLCFATDGRSYAFPLHIVLTRGTTDVIWRSVTSPFKFWSIRSADVSMSQYK